MSLNETECSTVSADPALQEELADHHGSALMRAMVLPAVVAGVQICLVVAVALSLTSRQMEAASQSPPPPGVAAPSLQAFLIELPPVADTFVQQDNAQANHGGSPVLEVSLPPGSRRNVILKFDIPVLPGMLAGATLRLHPATDWGDGNPDLKIVQCAPDWQEMTVTWRTQPDFGGLVGYLPGGTLTGTTAAEIPIDIGVVVAGEPLALAVELITAGQSVAFASREVAGKTPRLVLEIPGDGTPGPPGGAFLN